MPPGVRKIARLRGRKLIRAAGLRAASDSISDATPFEMSPRPKCPSCRVKKTQQTKKRLAEQCGRRGICSGFRRFAHIPVQLVMGGMSLTGNANEIRVPSVIYSHVRSVIATRGSSGHPNPMNSVLSACLAAFLRRTIMQYKTDERGRSFVRAVDRAGRCRRSIGDRPKSTIDTSSRSVSNPFVGLSFLEQGVRPNRMSRRHSGYSQPRGARRALRRSSGTEPNRSLARHFLR